MRRTLRWFRSRGAIPDFSNAPEILVERYLPFLAFLLLAACGKESAPATDTSVTASSAIAAAPASAASDGGIVIQAAPGGSKPDRFCIPQWSIGNQTGQDIGALLVHLEWRTHDGRVLEAARELGTLVEPFGAGRVKDFTLNGYAADCRTLRLVVQGYACRDADAVRRPCPGPLRAQASGGLEIDLSAAAESAMRGAVEPRP